MNLVMDDAEEVLVKEQSRKSIGSSLWSMFSVDAFRHYVGRLLLRGDNITLIMQVDKGN